MCRASPGGRDNHVVMFHETGILRVEHGLIGTVPPALADCCAAVVRDHHRGAAPEELERCLVPVQPARHLLVQICLYEEVPAVGKGDDNQVEVYPLTGVAVIKMPFVADPVHLGFSPWRLPLPAADV